jgi:hypothetical protein
MGVVDDLMVSHYFEQLTMVDMRVGDADFQAARFRDRASASNGSAMSVPGARRIRSFRQQ